MQKQRLDMGESIDTVQQIGVNFNVTTDAEVIEDE